MNLGKIINKKLDWAKYMVDEITYICKKHREKSTRLRGRKESL